MSALAFLKCGDYRSTQYNNYNKNIHRTAYTQTKQVVCQPYYYHKYNVTIILEVRPFRSSYILGFVGMHWAHVFVFLYIKAAVRLGRPWGRHRCLRPSAHLSRKKKNNITAILAVCSFAGSQPACVRRVFYINILIVISILILNI